MSYSTSSADLTGASDSHGVSVCQVVADTLGLWGVFSIASSPAFVLERALSDLNAAMQTVWNQAAERKYWSGGTISLTLKHADDTTSTDGLTVDVQSDSVAILPDKIQNVTGPCRDATTFQPLAPVGTQGELETFAAIYLDGATVDIPVAYHIDRMHQSGNEPAKCVFRCSPAVSVETTLLLDVVMEAPRYTTDDLASCPIIPIPHQYVESLLLPVVRHHASTFELFNDPARLPGIEAAYNQARAALGMADPLAGDSGENLPTRKGKPE